MKNVRYKYLFSIFFAFYIVDSCGNSNSLPPGKLNSGVWKCFSQISDLYTANGLSVQTSLRFTGKGETGLVEIFEGSENSKSCVSYGKYKLSNDRLSLKISSVENLNCPWMEKFNGLFHYQKGEKTYNYTNGNLRISILQ
jgi:hypothetical protein